jgi:hypothetical protein
MDAPTLLLFGSADHVQDERLLPGFERATP